MMVRTDLWAQVKYGAVFSLTLLFSEGSWALNRSEVVNNFAKDPYNYAAGIVVNWRAWGCFEVHAGDDRVCKTVKLRHYKDHYSYQYKLGASTDRITIHWLDDRGYSYDGDASCTVKAPDKGVLYVDAINTLDGTCTTHVVYPKVPPARTKNLKSHCNAQAAGSCPAEP